MKKEINGSWINKWWDFRVNYWFLSPIYSALNLIIAITLHLFEKITCKYLHEVWLVQLNFGYFKISYDIWAGKTITEIPALGKYLCVLSLNRYVEVLDQLHLLKNLIYVKVFMTVVVTLGDFFYFSVLLSWKWILSWTELCKWRNTYMTWYRTIYSYILKVKHSYSSFHILRLNLPKFKFIR